MAPARGLAGVFVAVDGELLESILAEPGVAGVPVDITTTDLTMDCKLI